MRNFGRYKLGVFVKVEWTKTARRNLLTFAAADAAEIDHRLGLTSGKSHVNALRDIVDSTERDVWITFHKSRLCWCRLTPGPVEEDEDSKFRRVADAWSDQDIWGACLLRLTSRD